MRNATLALVLLVTTGLLAACDTASEEGTQPRPDVTTFEQGDLDDIPLLPRSEPISSPSEEEGVVARSYLVRNTAPADVLRFYEEQLADATVVSEPEEIGANSFRGRWQLDQRRVLTVSATQEGGVEGTEDMSEATEVLTQYSLSLAPAPAQR